MTDPIDSIILDGLGDAGLRFVFPSEVAARARLEWALQASGRRALPVGRFMSWDAFKALAFPGPEEGQPASAAIRSIFARALMEENAKTPFLTHIIPREQAVASSRFARSVAKALPALRPFDGALNGPGGNLRDWRAIRERYASFLAERSLYEPGWNSR